MRVCVMQAKGAPTGDTGLSPIKASAANQQAEPVTDNRTDAEKKCAKAAAALNGAKMPRSAAVAVVRTHATPAQPVS